MTPFSGLPCRNRNVWNIRWTLFCFTLDVRERRVADETELEKQLQALQLARDVAAELREEDWNKLYVLLGEEKQRQAREADPFTLDAYFPHEAMGDGGPMIGFAEIFPFDTGFPFEFAQGKWLVHDQYCVKPECGCREIRLVFIRIPAGSSSRVEIRMGDMPAAFYDYRADTFKVQQKPRHGQPSLAILLNELKKAYPNLDAEFQRKHALLKILHKRARGSGNNG